MHFLNVKVEDRTVVRMSGVARTVREEKLRELKDRFEEAEKCIIRILLALPTSTTGSKQ